MSDVGRAIAAWTLLQELADRRLPIDRAIALCEVPASEADVTRARRLNLYLPEYERMRADVAKVLRAFTHKGR